MNRMTVVCAAGAFVVSNGIGVSRARAGDASPALPRLPPPETPSEPAAQAPVAPPTAAAPAAEQNRVYVHIDSGDGVELQRYVAGFDFVTWCTSPCDETVPASGGYRISGALLRPSEAFELRGGRVRLTVSAASNAVYTAGKLLTVLGALDVAFAGFSLIAVRVLSPFGDGPPDDSASTRMMEFGVALGVGVGIMGLGIPLMLTNDRSRVTQAAEVPPGAGDSPVRRPADERTSRTERPIVPRAATMPLVEITF